MTYRKNNTNISYKLFAKGLQLNSIFSTVLKIEWCINFSSGWWKNKQVSNVYLLFFSIWNFILWCSFLDEHCIHFFLIFTRRERNRFLNMINNMAYSCSENWIPGLISNTQLVLKSVRYQNNLNKKLIQFNNPPNRMYLLFSITKKNIIEELTNFLMPTMVILNNIVTCLTKYLILLFIPVHLKKYKYLVSAENTKFLYLNILLQHFPRII